MDGRVSFGPRLDYAEYASTAARCGCTHKLIVFAIQGPPILSLLRLLRYSLLLEDKKAGIRQQQCFRTVSNSSRSYEGHTSW